MKKITIGNLFTHPGHRLTRFVLCAIDVNNETFTAYNTLSSQLVEFHFSDQSDFKVAKTASLDSISY